MDPRPNQHQLYFPFEKKVSKENITFFSPYRLPNSKYYNRFPRNVKSKFKTGDPYGNRTHVCGVRGRRLNRLTNGPCHASPVRNARLPFDSDPEQNASRSPVPPRYSPFGLLTTARRFVFGAPSGIRTRDPLIKSQLLYQLS